MTAFADYEYYKKEFQGTMTESEFQRLSLRASEYVGWITRGKAWSRRDCPDVRKACCAVAEEMLLEENGGGVASESADGYQVNYIAGVSNTQPTSVRLRRTAERYLSGSGLLNRWI